MKFDVKFGMARFGSILPQKHPCGSYNLSPICAPCSDEPDLIFFGRVKDTLGLTLRYKKNFRKNVRLFKKKWTFDSVRLDKIRKCRLVGLRPLTQVTFYFYLPFIVMHKFLFLFIRLWGNMA